MNMNYTVRPVGDVTVLDLSGRISMRESLSAGSGTALVLHDLVRDFMDNGSRKVLVNLRHVTYVDSSGLGELISCVSTVQRRGGQMRICNPTERIRDLLRMTHMDTILECDQDEATAVQAFAAQSKSTAA